MATERALALVAVVAISCSPLADNCRAGTLLVPLTLFGGAAAADTLVIDVALDGGAPHESTLAHSPGANAGNVVVQFPAGYPRGHRVDVSVTATANGSVLGTASATVTLGDSCEVTPITVEESAGGDDLGELDLAGGADLAGASDLASGPDLRGGCVPTGAENCFNGIDDDCDGKIDCADGDCAPTAMCVPAATTPFAYLTEEPGNGTCPTDTTSGGTLYQANAAGGGCNNGSCGCDDSGCSGTVAQEQNMCPGGSDGPNVATIGSTCSNALSGLNNLHLHTPAGALSCATTGSATPVTPPLLTKALACDVTTVGGGCAGGLVCVPIGTKQCVSAAGSQQCPSGYPTGMTWYASYQDNRVCTCQCTPSSCASAGLRWYNSNQCLGAGVIQPTGNEICSNDYQFTKLGGACAPSASLGGTSLAFNGAATVCCE